MRENLESETRVLAAALVQEATEAGITITTAESCTGGMISSAITSISGSSAIFHCGFITYANEAKMKILGVPKEALEQHGAVSDAVATFMAIGALHAAGADLAVSVTGVAGPTGGTATKPVGLVYISVASKKETETKRFYFKGNREEIRLQSVHSALTMLLAMGT